MNPKQAWKPLPESKWNRDTARHLASRIGFSVNPEIVEEYHELKPGGVVEKYLLRPRPMEMLPSVMSMRKTEEDFRNYEGDEKRKMRQQFQRETREGYAEYAVAWNQFANQRENSPQEKLTSFFQNVWVVSYQGVKSIPVLFDYQNKIRGSLTGSYPELCYRLALTPAIGRYLNLNRSKVGAPNENFARELFELFTLGEGNYSETDIKEAARALTGYGTHPDGTVAFRKKAHDYGPKTVFGKTGRFRLEEILELIFQQPAASTFLPREFLRHYLSDEEVNPELVEELGNLWRKNGYSLPFLYTTVFSSQLFYEESFRGNMIKSPAHYFVGMHQDFKIDVLPLPRESMRIGRLMGQAFYNPPNVKGWDGGRAWINSATLAARRQIADSLLQPVNTKRLNADEQRVLENAQLLNPSAQYRIDVEDYFENTDSVQSIAHHISHNLFSQPGEEFVTELVNAILADQVQLTQDSKKRILLAALNSPFYQLC